MTRNLKDANYNNETAKARANLLRRAEADGRFQCGVEAGLLCLKATARELPKAVQAEAEGIKPFTSLEEVAGDQNVTTDFDVEAFLRQVREDRDRQTIRRSTDGDPGH